MDRYEHDPVYIDDMDAVLVEINGI